MNDGLDDPSLGRDDEVLGAAVRGDPAALTALYRAHHPRLVRYLRSSAPEAGDDLAAATWLAVAQGIAGFTGDSTDFRSWLFTIAHHRLVDHVRSTSRRRTTPTDPAVMPEATTASAEDLVEGRLEGLAAAQFVVRHLPPEQAQVVLLRVLGELPVDHVATIVGHSANWVRVTQHRALRRLASRIESKTGVRR